MKFFYHAKVRIQNWLSGHEIILSMQRFGKSFYTSSERNFGAEDTFGEFFFYMESRELI